MADSDQHSFGTRYERVDGGETATIYVHGEVDLAEGPRFADVVHQTLELPRVTVAIDLADVTFMDSSGLQQLLVARRDVTARNAEFLLVAPSVPVLRILDLCCLTDLFEIRGRTAGGRFTQSV